MASNQNVLQLTQQSTTDPTSVFYAVTGGTTDTGLPLSVLSSYLIKAYPGFLQVGTGAVTRSVQTRLQDTISVLDFGADPTGAVDSILNINAAITAANGELYFPPGTYKISAPISFTKSNLKIRGAGKGATTIQCIFAAGDIIAVGDGTANPNNVVLESFTITSTIAKTSGAAIRFRNGHFLSARDIRIDSNMNWGFQFDGGAQQFGYYLDLFEVNSGSYQIIVGDDGTLVQDLFVSNGVLSNATVNGVFLENVSGFQFRDIDIITAFQSFTTFPAATKNVQAGAIYNVYADTATHDGWHLLTNGGNVRDVVITSPWASSCGTSASDNGMTINPGAGIIDGLTIVSPRFNHNKGDGILISGGKNISIVNPQIFANSAAVTNTKQGIEVAAGVSDWSVTGGEIGQGGIWGATTLHQYGILVNTGSSNRYTIQGVNVNGNGTGGILDQGTGTSKIIQDPVGGIFAPTLQTSGTITTTGGNFIGAGTGYSIGNTTGLSSGGLIQIFDATHGSQGVSILAGGVTKGTFTTAGFTPSTTGGIVGTTLADNANAGSVGEVISSTVLVGAAVALTTATPANITSISLTAGDWDVWGEIVTNPAGTTVQSVTQGSISTTSATFPTFPNGGAGVILPFSNTGSSIATPVGLTRINVSTTTTVYLVGQSTFTTSTNAMYGFLGARRVR